MHARVCEESRAFVRQAHPVLQVNRANQRSLSRILMTASRGCGCVLEALEKERRERERIEDIADVYI